MQRPTTFVGSFGNAAVTFKHDELEALVTRFPGGFGFGIGNTASDESAYASMGVAADRVFLYQFDPENGGGTRIDDYANLVDFAYAQPSLCN